MSDNQLKPGHLFEQEGYLLGLPVLTPKEVIRYRDAYERLDAQVRERNPKGRITNMHHTEPEIWALANHPRVLDIVESIVGPDIVLMSTGFFAKKPHTGDQFVAWHQDTMYWGLRPPFALTVWIAIDDSDVDNGCMRVIPRTHRVGLLPHGTSGKAGNLLGQDQAIDPIHFDESSAVDFILKAGECSVHHGELVHGSNANGSDRRRCGMTVRFTTPNVSPVTEGPNRFVERPILVRGQDRFNHFTYAPNPTFAQLT